MTKSDLDLLLEMGFEPARAELAVKKTGGLQQALTWLEQNQDKPLEELQSSQAATGAGEDDEQGTPSLPSGETAQSLVCNECGKKFRNRDLASFHASKTDHTDFSESTEEIAPLTEEEKKAKLEELRKKLQEKRAHQSVAEREEQKRNEQIRLKATKESQDIKEELQRKEQMKEAAKKRQEKLEDLEAKKRIKARIEADRAERKRREEEAKAQREGRPLPGQTNTAPAPAAPAASTSSGPSTATTRLRFQSKKGVFVKTFPSETTLFEVAEQIREEVIYPVKSFTTTFPRKTFEAGIDFGKTLAEAGLAPRTRLAIDSNLPVCEHPDTCPLRYWIHRRDNPAFSKYRGILTPLLRSRCSPTMATKSEPKKMEWLVVIPDIPGAHEKRLAVRPQHFANLGPHKESGLFQMGGAVLNDVPDSLNDPSKFSFAGSTIVMLASSREEIKEVLRQDVYAKSGVWDVENAQMWPLLCAFRNHK
ncbi:hypothetical protein N657DRAFT_665613 [Parathielavia appendiculata]|uniref:C2H2-type domain-containing protein n=1 Tax=Parathielavia appendiculata TaxID=2587402 RepID=A0AAN6TW71_9PEZI|nr:hypothetical protein N657DRAFT_665613 [Parathielavia appendiculata]